jgi:hypothetical protein
MSTETKELFGKKELVIECAGKRCISWLFLTEQMLQRRVALVVLLETSDLQVLFFL